MGPRRALLVFAVSLALGLPDGVVEPHGPQSGKLGHHRPEPAWDERWQIEHRELTVSKVRTALTSTEPIHIVDAIGSLACLQATKYATEAERIIRSTIRELAGAIATNAPRYHSHSKEPQRHRARLGTPLGRLATPVVQGIPGYEASV